MGMAGFIRELIWAFQNRRTHSNNEALHVTCMAAMGIEDSEEFLSSLLYELNLERWQEVIDAARRERVDPADLSTLRAILAKHDVVLP